MSAASRPRLTATERAQAEDFALVADAIRKLYEPLGFGVYVSSNVQSITATEHDYVGGSEADFHIKVRRIPRGR